MKSIARIARAVLRHRFTRLNGLYPAEQRYGIAYNYVKMMLTVWKGIKKKRIKGYKVTKKERLNRRIRLRRYY